MSDQSNGFEFEKLIQVFSEIPFNQTLGLTLSHITDEIIVVRFERHEKLIGNFLHGILHGGVISAVLDMAGGVAVMIEQIRKKPGANLDELAKTIGKTSTINLQVDYIRPGKGEYFFAKAWNLHAGNKVSFAKMELYNNQETLIATGSGAYLIN